MFKHSINHILLCNHNLIWEKKLQFIYKPKHFFGISNCNDYLEPRNRHWPWVRSLQPDSATFQLCEPRGQSPTTLRPGSLAAPWRGPALACSEDWVHTDGVLFRSNRSSGPSSAGLVLLVQQTSSNRLTICMAKLRAVSYPPLPPHSAFLCAHRSFTITQCFWRTNKERTVGISENVGALNKTVQQMSELKPREGLFFPLNKLIGAKLK